jgi:hypothetical protein
VTEKSEDPADEDEDREIDVDTVAPEDLLVRTGEDLSSSETPRKLSIETI